MSETAVATSQRLNPVMNPVFYWRASAFALAAIALLGIAVNALLGNNEGLAGFLVFDWGHNVLHIVLALAAFVFGFAKLDPKIIKTFAIVFGVVYAGLGIAGFFVSDLGLLHLELGENLVHLLLGAWGLLAGLGSK